MPPEAPVMRKVFFMTVPPLIGSLLALALLALYPLHGARLAEVRARLAERRAQEGEVRSAL